ncbi:MAG: hypothetical protein Kow0032_22830 [Methyloligellaceae bacterium]
MVAERTRDLPPQNPLNRAKEFEAIFGPGFVVSEDQSNGFDLIDFEIVDDPNFNLPSTFAGMSGGGLWRVSYNRAANGKNPILDKYLIGVAFYESALCEGRRTIRCHGPRSVYSSLIDVIRERWQ